MFINRKNSTALVTYMAFPWIHNISSAETQKITKYENLALEFKKIWKLNNESIYTP